MNHATARPLLDRFLDCELDADTRWAVASHLDECGSCRTYLAEQAHMRTLVRGRLSQVVAPRRLQGRIHTAIQDATPGRWRLPRPGLGGLSLVAVGLAVALILLLPLGIVRLPQSGPDMASELAGPHRLFARDDTLLEIKGDEAAIQIWFRDKVSFPVAAPALTGFDLLGGRLVSVAGRRAALIVYEDPSTEQYLSLLYYDAQVDQAAGLSRSGPYEIGQSGQTTVVAWRSTISHIALLGNRPVPEMLRLAAHVRAQS